MIERVSLALALAAVLAAPAAAQEEAKNPGAAEAVKLEISFEKDKLVEKCAAGGVGQKCGAASFAAGKKDPKKKCVEFGELKHSPADKVDEGFLKAVAAEKKMADEAGWSKLDEKEKKAAKKMALLYAAHDSLENDLKAAEAGAKEQAVKDTAKAKEEKAAMACGGLKKVKKALAAEISKCEKEAGKAYKNLKCPVKPAAAPPEG